MPMMPFIGVRISWLMFARNMPLGLVRRLGALLRPRQLLLHLLALGDLLLEPGLRLLALLDLRAQLARPRVHQPGERPLPGLHAAHAHAVAAGATPSRGRRRRARRTTWPGSSAAGWRMATEAGAGLLHSPVLVARDDPEHVAARRHVRVEGRAAVDRVLPVRVERPDEPVAELDAARGVVVERGVVELQLAGAGLQVEVVERPPPADDRRSRARGPRADSPATHRQDGVHDDRAADRGEPEPAVVRLPRRRLRARRCPRCPRSPSAIA